MKKRTTRWVVKAGSQMVSSGGPILLRAWMDQVVRLNTDFQIQVVWVSSGAISSAINRTRFKKHRSDWDLCEKQALSAIGQPILMDLYNLALSATGLLGAQVLLTAADIANRDRRKNLQGTIEQLLYWKVLPILNENDAIATDEIKFGDNDTLSAKVATMIGAQRLVILTDVDGLYDRNPSLNPGAKLIPRVQKISPQILALAGRATSHIGTGGMLSKVKAAQEAKKENIETVLVKGDAPSVLLKVAQGDFVGTVFEVSHAK